VPRETGGPRLPSVRMPPPRLGPRGVGGFVTPFHEPRHNLGARARAAERLHSPLASKVRVWDEEFYPEMGFREMP
jgi:hypothetical protein